MHKQFSGLFEGIRERLESIRKIRRIKKSADSSDGSSRLEGRAEVEAKESVQYSAISYGTSPVTYCHDRLPFYTHVISKLLEGTQTLQWATVFIRHFLALITAES